MNKISREQWLVYRYLMRVVIEHLGERLVDEPEPLRVAGAREVVALRCDLYNCMEDERVFSLLLAELEATILEMRDQGLGKPPTGILYRTEGIEFAALVELEQIAAPAASWGWTGDDLHRLGVELARGDELSWITEEYAEIRSQYRPLRNFYRRH